MNRLKQFSISLVSNYDRTQTLRVVSLAFFYLALFGPWVYERINVPAEYSCNFPNVRLEGDYCGVPLSGFSILFMMLEGLSAISSQLMAGTVLVPHRTRDLLFIISFILLPLPFFGTLLVLLKRNTHRLQIFHLAMWTLGTFLGLFWLVMVLSFPYSHKWSLWGFWSYLIPAIGMLILESFALKIKRTRTRTGN